jgi:hypothetical protein
MPNEAEFTAFLRRTIRDIMNAGYASMLITQSELYMIHKAREKDVPVAEGVRVTNDLDRWYNHGRYDRLTFFPGGANSAGGNQDCR